MSTMSKQYIKIHNQQFFCPLGQNIMWWHNLEYKDCPLAPSYRDMPECKNCKLRVDKKWEANKETWKDKPIKKKKRPRGRRKKQGDRK